MAERITYNIPLRVDFMAALVLPHDLTEHEAARLILIIKALPLPPPPVVAQHVDNEPGREADPAEQQQKER